MKKPSKVQIYLNAFIALMFALAAAGYYLQGRVGFGIWWTVLAVGMGVVCRIHVRVYRLNVETYELMQRAAVMSDLRQIITDQTLGRLFGDQITQARAVAEPPTVRAGTDPRAVAAYSWLLHGKADIADGLIDKLDADDAMTALTAASDMAIALGRRLNQLRAQAVRT